MRARESVVLESLAGFDHIVPGHNRVHRCIGSSKENSPKLGFFDH